MDLVSLLTDLIDRCIQGYNFLKDVKTAPKACLELMEELDIDRPMLVKIQEHVNRVEDRATVPSLASLPESLRDYKTTLDKLDSVLKVYGNVKFRFNIKTRTKWMLRDEEKIKALCDDLKQNSRLLQVLSIQIARDIAEMNEHQQEADAKKVAWELAKRLYNIVKWLEPLNSEAKLWTVREQRWPHTCEWLSSHDLFVSWYKSSGSFLWLNGIPGSGKTVLASFVIDHLKERVTSDQIVLFAFADFQDVRSTDVVVLLRTLLAQLLDHCKPEDLLEDFGELETLMQQHHADLPKSVDHLIQLLEKASAYWKRVFIVLDAVDGIKIRREYLPEIHELSAPGSKFSIFVTSRGEQDIIEILSGVPTITLGKESQRAKDDLRRFIEDKMNTSYLPLARLREPFRAYVILTLLEKSKGMFSLVDRQLQSLAKARFESDIDKILESLPTDLNSMYERIFQSIEAEGQETVQIVQRTLWWLVGSHRQLRLAELMEAVMVETGRDSPNTDLKPLSGEHLLEMCSSLIRYDAGTDIVTLSHASVQDFLFSDYLRGTAHHRNYHIPSFSFLHQHITGLILAYLHYEDFQHGPCTTEQHLIERLEQHPFLVYVVSNWDLHIVKMYETYPESEEPPNFNRLITLFDDSGKNVLPAHCSRRQVSYFGADLRIAIEDDALKLEWQSPGTFSKQDYKSHHYNICEEIDGFVCPHRCAGPSWLVTSAGLLQNHPWQGLSNATSVEELDYMVYPLVSEGPASLVRDLLHMLPQFKEHPLFYFGTPLMISIFSGKLDTVKMLLQDLHLNVNTCAQHHDCNYEVVSPIFLATKYRHVEVVRWLLDHGSATVFSPAPHPEWFPEQEPEYGHSDIISNTVFSGQRPDDGIAYTIIAAAEYGHADVLEVLICHGVNVNTRSIYSGCTTIHAAVVSGSIDCVRLLGDVGHRVNSHFESRTPLQVALELQSSTIVQLLLSQGSSPHECWYLSLDSLQWALEKDWYPEVETCLAQLEYEQLIEVNRSQGDIEEVVRILKLVFHLPSLLIRRIFDFAEFWIAVTCERQEEIMINQHSHVEPYISTPPINYKLENPIRRIVFRISSHDQGWSSDGNALGVYSGSLTWFEADVDSAHGMRREILRNARADFRSRTHTRVWDYQDEFASLDMWMANIKSGDSISIYPRASHGGWVNYVESMTVIVFTAFI